MKLELQVRGPESIPLFIDPKKSKTVNVGSGSMVFVLVLLFRLPVAFKIRTKHRRVNVQ